MSHDPARSNGAGSVAVPEPHLPVHTGPEGCIELLAGRLRDWPGVLAIEANFRAGTLTVRYQPDRVTPEQLNAIADDVGAVFADRVTTCEKRDSIGACSECALRFGRLDQGRAAQFAATATPGRVLLTRRDALDEGVEVVRPLEQKPWGAAMSPGQEEQHSTGRSMIVLTGVCLLALLGGMVTERMAGPDPRSALLARAWFVVAAVTGGWFATLGTIESLRRLKFDVNLLMILAAAGAAAIGYVFEAAVLMFLFSLSNTLEVYTMGRTRHALHALLKLRPARALVLRDGRELEVEVESVRVGETVIVKPGEAFPVDGTVTRGASQVDQSSLTGESVPVEKHPGDKVFAGTLNQLGALEVLATRAAANSALARIVALVEQAQKQKSRTEEVAQWVGRYYTVAVMIGAGLMLLVPPLLLHAEWKYSFYRAMTLLVVASPCALVIATPATILSAIANAARNGILFKGGRFIEALARVRAIAFDKTGTLTHGRFEVTDVVAIEGATADELLGWAATAERRSPHPLAQAVVRAAELRQLACEPAAQMLNHLGKGLVATHDGATIEVGKPELFASLGTTPPAAAIAQVHAFAEDGRTAMIVHRGAAWGVIAAADQLRPTAAVVVRELRGLGFVYVALLSGDNEKTVESVAARTGVDEKFGQLLPEDKVRVVAGLEAKYGSVAMLGDGVNDAPALARATVGIAMGGIGSDVAMESADVVLMADDLTALPYAVRLAQRATRVVAQNLVIATGVMLLLVAWVFAGGHTPLGPLKLPIAVSGHEGSTVIVILNGLRLLGGRRALR